MTPVIDLVIVAIVAIFARALAQIVVGFYAAPEAWEYDEVARNVLAGEGWIAERSGTTWQALVLPTYPLMLIAAYGIFGFSPWPVGVLHLVLGAGLAAAVLAIGCRTGDRRVALLAGLGAATHPGLLVFSAKIHALNVDALVIALSALVVLRFRERPDRRNAVLGGIVAGLAAITRPTALAVYAAGLPAAILGRPGARGIARRVLLAAVVAGVIAAPWVIRNQVVLGRPSLTPTFGEALWVGNNPFASGGALAPDGRPILDLDSELRALTWGHSELEQDELYRTRAIAYMAEDPWRTARAFASKFVQFWWFAPQTGAVYPRAWLLAYEVYYAVVALLAILGALALVRRRRWWLLSTLVLVAVSVSATQSIFYVDGRHRWGVEALLLVLAATGLTYAMDRVGRSTAGRTLPLAPLGRSS